MTTITQDDEREAREWLNGKVWPVGVIDAKHRATILALLDAPRLPRPEDVPGDVLHDAYDRGCGTGHPVLSARAVYRHIRDHYTAPPQPKKVVAWAAVDEDGIWATDKDENMIRKYLAHKDCRIVRLVEDRDGE